MKCTDPKYIPCPPATAPYLQSTNDESSIHQIKNRLMTMTVGGTVITLQKRVRDFTIHGKVSTANLGVTFLHDPDTDGTIECIGGTNYTFTGDVSESYQCIDSTLFFLDTRYDNAVVKEVDQTLTFSVPPTAAACYFKLTWGIVPYHMFKITNGQIHTITTWYLIVNGVKQILKTTDVTAHANIPILIYPQPPSMGIPQDPDVIAQGFYDYFGDSGPDLAMALRDGGQDYYYPEWCQRLGADNRTLDIQEATDRYSAIFLKEPPAVNQTMTMPTIPMNGEFYGSMCVDPSGNLFYSMKLDGVIYNHLDGQTDITELIKINGANPEYFPVGLI